jgi:prepilin-type N-terminal cleavage/methylation domain-containing protein
LPCWVIALGAWVAAYGVFAAALYLVVGGVLQVGVALNQVSPQSLVATLVMLPLWALPLGFACYKLRCAMVACALPAVPTLVMGIRGAIVYWRIELPSMERLIDIIRDLSFFPLVIVCIILASYIARRVVHMWLPHDSLKPTCGPTRQPRQAAASASRGFSIVELLVVVAIIALILGIIIPVIASARRRGAQATDISNMRQIALAIASYRQDREYAPMDLKDLIPSYVESGDIFLSPADPTAPYGWWTATCFVDRYMGFQTYVYLPACGEDPRSPVLPDHPEMRDLYGRSVEEPDWGILCCPVYMDVDERYWGEPTVVTESGDVAPVRAWLYEKAGGVQLRVAADGSLRRVHAPPLGEESCSYYLYYLMDGAPKE